MLLSSSSLNSRNSEKKNVRPWFLKYEGCIPDCLYKEIVVFNWIFLGLLFSGHLHSQRLHYVPLNLLSLPTTPRTFWSLITKMVHDLSATTAMWKCEADASPQYTQVCTLTSFQIWLWCPRVSPEKQNMLLPSHGSQMVIKVKQMCCLVSRNHSR